MVMSYEEAFLFNRGEIKFWNDFSLDNKQENITKHIFLPTKLGE